LSSRKLESNRRFTDHTLKNPENHEPNAATGRKKKYEPAKKLQPRTSVGAADGVDGR
jgi:hypothetical protein